MQYYPQLIIDALKQVRYPGNGKNLVENDMLEDDIRIEGNKISFSLIFDKQNDPFMKSVVKAAEQAILTFVDEAADIKGNIAVKYRKPIPVAPEKPLSQVKHVLAISSGKGGVGKSTVSANLAVALAQKGYRVGLLDADVHGPSIPKMFAIEDARPLLNEVEGKDLIVPIEKYGVKVLSIGFFVDPDSPVIWRGGMASNAVKQLINEGDWGELDYFLIDLPPGTSDIHLTIVQTLQLSGAVVVTTPQAVALADARKGINMFRNDKIDVPVWGIVENMAWFTPAELPNNRYYIFGKDGGKNLADELGTTLLGQVPLVQSIREGGDEGLPIALQEGHPAAACFLQVADNIIARDVK